MLQRPATVSDVTFLSRQIKYGDTATSEGVLFATYSALIGESQAGGQHRTRLKQILDWCKPGFDGVVSFPLVLLGSNPRVQARELGLELAVLLTQEGRTQY